MCNVSAFSGTVSNSLSHAMTMTIPRCDGHIEHIEPSIASLYPCVRTYIYICTCSKCTCACFASNFVELRELFLSKTLYAFRFRFSLSRFLFARSSPFASLRSCARTATLEETLPANVRTRYLLHCLSRKIILFYPRNVEFKGRRTRT